MWGSFLLFFWGGGGETRSMQAEFIYQGELSRISLIELADKTEDRYLITLFMLENVVEVVAFGIYHFNRIASFCSDSDINIQTRRLRYHV